jgi:prepilin-type N-terminal cleavage/methylation domain-containing protein
VQKNRHAFTLLEVVISVFILLLILTIGIPSMSGLSADRRLRRSLDAVNGLVGQAQQRSVHERRAYLIAWEKDRLVLRPEGLDKGESEDPVAQVPFQKGDKYQLDLPAALMKETPAEWVFWPTGTCEPATLKYTGPSGSWVANYPSLTARAEIASYAAK